MKVLRLMHRGSLSEVSVTLRLNPAPVRRTERPSSSGAVRYWLGKEVRSDAFLERLEGERAAAPNRHSRESGNPGNELPKVRKSI